MPASVGRTVRVVRASRGVPRRDSSELTARETAADDIPTLSAAPVKLPRSTMATKSPSHAIYPFRFPPLSARLHVVILCVVIRMVTIHVI